MQEVCFHRGCSCKCLQDAADAFLHAEIDMLQKSACVVFFYFRDSAALADRCTIDPSKDALQLAMNEAEMSKGG